ncbi:uncharacterized protein UV8b_01381 [Ustilaginoidea virens]|uniref:Programmed cell death protein 2 C-terminal domain-containing protein n=1 Tax=Ustilaginoidea virens TaxID=1159556 RepID=A0A8E5HKH9_USTVR|nr:uncharacterized protein UV8b_01381 [Ustilaginoidea virens]QUC17140.1 hypothetical protein UV8b_01381 [Ustilaginoidea virens]
MASYDSDSSDGEFTETNVLLGYASTDAEDETISRLGGTPEWLDADKPPSAALARCKACNDLMVLLLQLNTELPEKFPGHDRRLYVFVCRRETCRRKAGSIRALRGVRIWDKDVLATTSIHAAPKEEELEPKSQGAALGDALFGKGPGGSSSSGGNLFSGNANPFSTGSGTSMTNPFSTSSAQSPLSSQPQQDPPAHAEPKEKPATSPGLSKTFAETLSLDTTSAKPPQPYEPWPDALSRPKPYPTLYLAEADYETLEPTSAKIPANARIEEADAPETVSSLDKEAFESSMDATFQKFADRLAQNPDQVIRYEFGGTPLLYSKTDVVGEMLSRGSIPGCPNCGGRRTFEVQLTPNAIAVLEADDLGLEGMEWGTIVVGVCDKDCAPRHVEKDEPGYLEEWAGVQWEELAKQN